MKRPSPVWECEYRADRRKHNHRCFCCQKVIKTGEAVLMCRVAGGGCKACHIEHADNLYASDQGRETVRDIMTIWGLTALKRAGWTVTDSELEPTSPPELRQASATQ